MSTPEGPSLGNDLATEAVTKHQDMLATIEKTENPILLAAIDAEMRRLCTLVNGYYSSNEAVQRDATNRMLTEGGGVPSTPEQLLLISFESIQGGAAWQKLLKDPASSIQLTALLDSMRKIEERARNEEDPDYQLGVSGLYDRAFAGDTGSQMLALSAFPIFGPSDVIRTGLASLKAGEFVVSGDITTAYERAQATETIDSDMLTVQ